MPYMYIQLFVGAYATATIMGTNSCTMQCKTTGDALYITDWFQQSCKILQTFFLGKYLGLNWPVPFATQAAMSFHRADLLFTEHSTKQNTHIHINATCCCGFTHNAMHVIQSLNIRIIYALHIDQLQRNIHVGLYFNWVENNFCDPMFRVNSPRYASTMHAWVSSLFHWQFTACPSLTHTMKQCSVRCSG